MKTEKIYSVEKMNDFSVSIERDALNGGNKQTNKKKINDSGAIFAVS